MARAEQIYPDDLHDLPEAQVVILGELHDNPTHHVHQATAVAGIASKALVFEMLTPEQAARITPDNRGDRDGLAVVLEWAESGWPDFAMYHPIMTAAPDAAIYGAAVPREQARAVFSSSAAEVFGPDAPDFGLDAPLPDAEQKTREDEQMAAHCNALPEHLLGGMVAAQRLRDASLARAVRDALADHGGPVVVITGNGHARLDRGLAVYLRAAMPDVSILSVGQFEEVTEPPVPFDLWLVSDPADRDDPCAAFQ